MTYRYCKPAVRALGFAAGLMLVSAGGASAQQPATPATPIKLGIVSFLSGPAASPFGVPGRNSAARPGKIVEHRNIARGMGEADRQRTQSRREAREVGLGPDQRE